MSENGPALTSADHGASGGLYIEYDLQANGYKTGDTFTYVLPNNFYTTAPNNTTFTFVATYNGTDYPIGMAAYSFGKVRVVMNEGVEQLDGIRGHFWIGGNYLGTLKNPDMTLNLGTDQEYTIRITFTGDSGNPGTGAPPEHGKYASFKEGSNNSIVQYSVGVNMDKSRVYVAGSTIIDKANGLVVNPATLKVERVNPTVVLTAGVDYTVDFFADGSGFTITLLTTVDQEFWFAYESSVFEVADVYRNDVTAVIPDMPDGGDSFGHDVSWRDISGSSEGYLRDLTLIKKDQDTKQPLSGAVFDLYRTIDGLDRLVRSGLTSGGDGKLVASGLLSGEYKLVEISRPSGYTYVDGKNSVSVTLQPGQSANIEIDFYNQKEETPAMPGAAELNKVDDTNAPLEGAEFTIYDDMNAIRDSQVTDASGNARFSDLVPGVYTVKETKAPTGFVASEEALAGYQVTVVSGETAKVMGSGLNGAIVNVGPPTLTPDEPALKTTATNKADGSKVILYVGGTITDTVSYTGLTAGKQYKLLGQLMDKSTGRMVPGTSTSVMFTASTANGEQALDLTLPKGYAGKSIVVYEYLYESNGTTLVAKHTELGDAGQTVTVNKSPTIGTTATNKDDGSHTLTYDGGVIVDEVRYTGLNPGKFYTILGELMGKELNETTGDSTAIATGITSEITFQPEAADGSVTLEFVVDGSYANTKLVAFEKLFDDNGKLVAQHEEIESTEQTITVGEVPRLVTTAANKDDAEQPLEFQGGTITDNVEYTNLIPGVEYTLKGELMDKATGESTDITAERTFVPESANGSIELDFMVASGFAGKRLVAFETLVESERVIATHRDIDSEEQTVDIRPEPTVTTSAADKADGDKQLSENGGIIVDTVYYTGLIPGREYMLQGELMHKEDGAWTGLSATRTFVPETADGAVDLELTVPAGYKDTWVVVFETVLNGDLVVTEHKDIDSEAQSIFVDHTPLNLAITGSTIMASLGWIGVVLVSLGGALFAAVRISNRRTQKRGADTQHS